MFGEPCVKEGKTNIITFTTDLTAPGTPTNAEVVPDSGKAMERDPIFADDPVGAVDDVRNVATGSTSFPIPIENKGGSLSGPNGQSLNGGNEGPCIEVYVEFDIRYRVTICKTETLEFHGSGGSTSECWEVWRYETKTWRKHARKVCPC
jgi:hypothetical protein